MFLRTQSSPARVKVPSLLVRGLTLAILFSVSIPMVPRATHDARAHEVHEAPSIRSNMLVRLGKRLASAPTPQAPKPTLLPIVMQDDISAEHQVVADQVLRALPSFCRENLKNFYVNYEPNPKNRGLGGASTIIIAGRVPIAEFIALLIHECGHVIDLGGLRGTPASGKSTFVDGQTPMYNDDPSVAFYSISWTSAKARKSSAREADFVSGYAVSDVYEDFSETLAFFVLQNAEFRRLAETNAALRAKYDFMERVVFRGTPTIASGEFVRGPRAPWDVTRLPYEWHASH